MLVVQTGCSAHGSAKAGYMTPENALENAGPGLREVCEAIGIPPILHMGSCVDNSRILTVATAIAEAGGLGDDIGGLPAVGIAPEWMSEKAIAIGTYFVASGVPIIFGAGSPVSASKTMKDLMENKWWDMVGAGFYFEEDPGKILELTLKLIDTARGEAQDPQVRAGQVRHGARAHGHGGPPPARSRHLTARASNFDTNLSGEAKCLSFFFREAPAWHSGIQ